MRGLTLAAIMAVGIVGDAEAGLIRFEFIQTELLTIVSGVLVTLSS